MTDTLVLTDQKLRINSYFFNLAAVVSIYLVPTFSHLLSFPVYMIDPMRIIILLSVIHTSNKNAYLIALTLPIFSFLIASHPVAIKSILITSELVLNIWLFYQIYNKLSNKFSIMFLSIVISKVYYYLIKAILVSSGILQGEIFSTPIYLQIAVASALGGYLYLFSGAKPDR
jgi:hypothetical protein